MSPKRKDHFLLNEVAGWRAAQLDHVTLNAEAETLTLRPLPGVGRPLADAAGTFGGLSLPTAIAVGADGLIYILDGEAHAVKRYNPCTETFETLSCVGGKGSLPRRFLEPRGMAISPHHDLHIVDAGNRRVQVFALKGLSLRSIWGPYQVVRGEASVVVRPASMTWPPAGAAGDCAPVPRFPDQVWQPWDIAITCHGQAYVSDYAHGLIHVFDKSGCWRAAFNGESPQSPALAKPTHLATDKKGRLYVVQEAKDFVVALDPQGRFLKQIKWRDDARGEFCPGKIGVDGNGNLYLSDRVTRRLRRIDSAQSQVCSCAEPLPTFPGECTTIAFDVKGNPLLGDERNRCVTLLPDQVAYDEEGRYFSEALDSQIYQCRWHRVALEADVPRGTQIQIDTFTSESLKTAVEIDGLPESRWATNQVCSKSTGPEWDCLVTGSPGRFLWLRLTLRGDGTVTPGLRSARVYAPRASSLRYLPAVFSEDPSGTDFLARFLSIFDALRGKTNDLLTNLPSYLDPRSTPAAPLSPGSIDFLTWLASWLGLSLDRHWPEAKRRELVRQAHRLYRERGTAEGLRLHLKLYTGLEPRIVEHFQLRRWLYLNHGRLGDQSALYGSAVVSRLQLNEHSSIGSFSLIDSGDPLHDPFHHYAHQFTVFVPIRGRCGEVEKQTIERIVEMAKPAHALAGVQIVEPRFRVGTQAFIGLDTVIGHYPQEVKAGRAKLGYDTLLGPSEDEGQSPTLRIGSRSRIGSDTQMD